MARDDATGDDALSHSAASAALTLDGVDAAARAGGASDLHAAAEHSGQASATARRMRLLFLSPHYPPDVAATGQLVAELAEDAVGAGHQVIVVASRPSYTGDSPRRYRLFERELRNGVEIHWLGIPRLGRRGLWSRLLPFAGYFIAALMRCVFLRRIDIVFAQSTPPLLAGLLGRALALVPGRRFVYNLQDVYPELGQALGVLNNGLLSRLAAAVERRLRRSADLLTVLGDDMKRHCTDGDPHLDAAVVVPNWADTQRVFPVDRAHNPFIRRHRLEERFVVMYSGNLGRAHGAEMLPAVAAALSDLDDLVLVLVGDGPARAAIEAQIDARALTNVLLLPYQPRETLNESLSAADLGLILQRAPTLGLLVPSKLYGILASGRAAVASVPAGSEVAQVLEREQAGVTVAPGDAQALAQALRALHGERERVRVLGRNARAAAIAHYDRVQVTARYLQLFRQLTAATA